MKYVSTRAGDSAAQPIGFLDAVLAGLAPDGGLYVPETWPTFTTEEIAAFAGQPYARVAAAVIGKFADGEIPTDVLEEMCAEAYGTFAHAATCPVVQLGPNLFLAELFHGPTLAFKDFALQLLGRLLDYVLERKHQKVVIMKR